MKKAKTLIMPGIILVLLISYGNMSGSTVYHSASEMGQSVQTKPKSTQTKPKSTQTKPKATQTKPKATQTKPKTPQKATKAEPVKKVKEIGTIVIGTQTWSVANLNVSTFRNGDSIPQARSNKEWEVAGQTGKPAWCYYNNDPANGVKYGKLYNWYAVNDPRGLAPEGWALPADSDWATLTYFLGGPASAGNKMKSISGWSDGNNGTNESGFTGLPGGYRVENGTFLNQFSIGIWWSSTEERSQSAIDHYLVLAGSLGRSSTPKQRGESVRCLRSK